MSLELSPPIVLDPDPRRVYIVDDDPAVRRSTSILLTTSGYETRPFVNGADFLEEAPALRPGVVLLDLRMPEVDGLALLERLPEAVRSQLPIIVITGHGDLPSAVRAMKTGARDFLEKPFEEAVLLEILEGAFASLQKSAAEHARRAKVRELMRRLTAREKEVLRGLALGRPNKVVAHQLGLSTRTVEMHRANLLQRLGVRTLAEAVRLSFEAQIEL